MTIEKWKNKLDSFVQKEIYANNKSFDAALTAAAVIFDDIEKILNYHINQVSIDLSERPFLLQTGLDQGENIKPNESLDDYRNRLKNFSFSVNCNAILAIANFHLKNKNAFIVEDFNFDLFLNEDLFLNRNFIIIDPVDNTFSLIIPNQNLNSDVAFFGSDFYNRESFLTDKAEDAGFSDDMFANMIEDIKNKKALGTDYRVIERVA